MTTRKFAFDVSWVFISQVITLATGFLLSVILGRVLGAAAFGLFTMTLIIYTIASLVGGIGIPSAIVKYVAEFKENKEKVNIFVSCGVVNSVFFGVITGSVLFVLSGMLANTFNMPELTNSLKIIAFSLPFLVVNNTLLGLLSGLREMKSYSLRTVIRSSLLLSFTVLLVGIGFGIKGAVLALVLSEVGTLFLLIFISKNFFCFVIRDYVKTTKEVVKFGSQLFLASATVTYPAISEYNGKKQHEAIETLINKSMKYSLIVLSILGLLIVFFSKDIILLLLTPEFLPAITPLAILIFGVIFSGAANSVGAAWTAMGRPDLCFKLNIPVLFVNLGIDVVLIPTLGITGAAIGTATSLSLLTLISFPIYNKIFNVKIDVRRYILSVAVAGLLITIFFIGSELMNYYLLIGILLLVYIIIVIKFLLTKEDIGDFRSIIKHVFQKTF
jgi:O-antigen/teichoic acid export membrane protein